MSTVAVGWSSTLGSAVSGSAARDDEFCRHRGPITSVAPLPGGRGAITGGYDSAVGVVDFRQTRIRLLGYHRHLVNSVAVDPTGRSAASCSSDYTICIWDLQREVPRHILRGHQDDVEGSAFIDAT